MTYKDIEIKEVANQASEIQDKGDTEFRLKLNHQPDSTWSHAFNEAYNSVKGSDWRSVRIVGREIFISCHHSYLKETYLPTIQSAINTANEKSKKISEAYASDMSKKNEAQAKKQSEKKSILDDINDQFK